MIMHLNQPKRGGRETDSALVGLAMLFSMLGSAPALATPPASCHMRLAVELTPDVPNPLDAGFLSSLLSNHPGYHLILRRERSGSVIVLGLTGPGPLYRCQKVIDTMRRDGRVLSVQAQEETS
jgi:hypothetical protein